MTSTSGVVAIQKKTRAAAAPEHFATLQPAQKTEFKPQTQRRNHTPIHDNTLLLHRLIRELHHHPTEIREISLSPNESATVERKRTKVEEQKGWSPNPKTIARGARV
jgi:hypothetical protein